MTQNNSIFTRVLALVLCMLMCAGVLTACFQMPEFNPVLNSNGVLTPDATTDNVADNTPNEDPTTPEEPVDPNVIFSASTTVDANNLILGALTNDVVIGGEGATALVPADVVLETGASSLALTLKNVEGNDVDFGDAELLNNLDVHISGIAANNTVPMTVALGAILEAGLGATDLKLYHIVKMVKQFSGQELQAQTTLQFTTSTFMTKQLVKLQFTLLLSQSSLQLSQVQTFGMVKQ